MCDRKQAKAAYNQVWLLYTYDAVGNKETTIDPLDRITQTEYDEQNRVERTIVNYVDGVHLH